MFGPYQIDDAGWRRLIFNALCIEKKTFAGFLSPSGIGMSGLEIFATNVAGQRLRGGRCVVEPEVVLMETEFSDKTLAKVNRTYSVERGYGMKPGVL